MNHTERHPSTAKYLFAAGLLLLGWVSPLLAQDIVGDWDMTMDFNGNKSMATLTIAKSPDGTLSGKWGASDLSNVKLEGDKLTFTRTVKFGDNEFTSNYAGTVKDGKLTGQWSSDRGEFEASGVKMKPMSPVASVWDMSYKVGDRDITGQLSVSQKPDGSLNAKCDQRTGRKHDLQCAVAGRQAHLRSREQLQWQ